jgi:hypothetical protein
VDLKSKLSSVLRDQSALPWFPQLTEDLVNSAWNVLYAGYGYTQQNYSTSRIIKKNAQADRNVSGTLAFDNFEGTVILEKLPSNHEADFEALGLCFSQENQSTTEYQLSELKLAFNIIAEVPSLFLTVLTLVRSIHILKAESDQHDVSFSDPTIPFSIFISIPSIRKPNSSIRLAEAIIHEAMHLQLTLIENFCPLILEDNNKLFSPWKNEDRRPSGVLHALYVFAVIYTSLPLLDTSNKKIITKRRLEIQNQILQIDSFRLTQGFTPIGQFFKDYLFACFDSPIHLDGSKKA